MGLKYNKNKSNDSSAEIIKLFDMAVLEKQLSSEQVLPTMVFEDPTTIVASEFIENFTSNIQENQLVEAKEETIKEWENTLDNIPDTKQNVNFNVSIENAILFDPFAWESIYDRILMQLFSWNDHISHHPLMQNPTNIEILKLAGEIQEKMYTLKEIIAARNSWHPSFNGAMGSVKTVDPSTLGPLDPLTLQKD